MAFRSVRASLLQSNIYLLPHALCSMPSEMKPRFVLLYGSQKGQAQAIAEGVAEEAETHGLFAELSCLENNEKYNLETETAPVVFIVSTTGDGEPPDNALKFVRNIKKKTLSSDHYKHISYALLGFQLLSLLAIGLGDTNYANFCNCGKAIDRRLRELGASQFYASGYADDGVGLELVVDPWIKGLWNAIKEELSNMTSKQTECVKEEVRDSSKETPDPSTADMQLNLLSIANCQNCKSIGQSEKLANLASPSVSTTQTAGSDLRPDSSSRRIGLSSRTDGALSADAGVASLTHSLPPLSQSALNIPALPPPYLCVSLQEMETTEDIFGPLNKENLQEVPISKATQLTRGDSVKTALLLELDISTLPAMTYQPGDAFDVYWPNSATEVEDMLHRLGLQDQRNHRVLISLLKDTKKRGAQVPSYIPQNASLLYLLTWCLEIRSVPKKAFLRALVEYTVDGVQKRRLQELCSKQGTTDYNSHLREQSLSILELLNAFPSCSPPLSILIEHVPKLQPRPYSVAREEQRRQNPLATFGETWLFFGCRHRDQDFLFREELESFVSSGVLSHLQLSFSRDDPEEQEGADETISPTAQRRYVQHNLKLHGRQVTDILLKQKGCIYVCGDARNMAKDVDTTLMEVIKAELGMDQLEAMKTLAALREEKRYLQDIWG
ncbi:methionine synthase reductase isoform X7 [Takifugu rubripes]|uniref:methionine synthase reductase isoform X7 n=1 Tax=Takifugu rubripes TaxID=31033 RepID=UPI001145E2F5|nr:methionine synthase reductase isoform X7 [Takifugu rubripes]